LDPGTPAGERETALAAALDLIRGIVVLPSATTSRLRQAIATGSGRPELASDGPGKDHPGG